jgi:hypothetical protein
MFFDSWGDGEAFYTRYAHEAGFSVHRFTQHKVVMVWCGSVFLRKARREGREIYSSQPSK